MKKVAVVLSGCGVFDGSEIHEAVLTLLALDQHDTDIKILAPDMEQMHVVNHLTGAVSEEKRNVLVEAARIARGEITDLSKVKAEDFDAAVFPGGFGAAKNLCDFAVKGTQCRVNPAVEAFIKNGLKAKIPMGFICIAPALLVRVAGSLNLQPRVTIGTDADTAAAIETMGGRHVPLQAEEYMLDSDNCIVSTPAYMLGQSISEVSRGIHSMVAALIDLI